MRKLLIVDDSMYMRKLIGMILQKEGYQVVGEAANGANAVELAKDLHPDIITLDNVLPDMLGIDAIKLIRKLNLRTKVLMVSPIGQPPMIKEALISGIDDYLLKPFTPEELVYKARMLEA